MKKIEEYIDNNLDFLFNDENLKKKFYIVDKNSEF
jgi:hypothetical protein